MGMDQAIEKPSHERTYASRDSWSVLARWLLAMRESLTVDHTPATSNQMWRSPLMKTNKTPQSQTQQKSLLDELEELQVIEAKELREGVAFHAFRFRIDLPQK